MGEVATVEPHHLPADELRVRASMAMEDGKSRWPLPPPKQKGNIPCGDGSVGPSCVCEKVMRVELGLLDLALESTSSFLKYSTLEEPKLLAHMTN
jgi:hypothetical protein